MESSKNRSNGKERWDIIPVEGLLPNHDFAADDQYRRLTHNLTARYIEFAKARCLCTTNADAIRMITGGQPTNRQALDMAKHITDSKFWPETQALINYLTALQNQAAVESVKKSAAPCTIEEMALKLEYFFRTTKDAETALKLVEKIMKLRSLTPSRARSIAEDVEIPEDFLEQLGRGSLDTAYTS